MLQNPKTDPKSRPTVDSTKDQPRKFCFTQDKLERLPLPTEGRVYYNDTIERYLQLKVNAFGRKQFRLYRKVHGRPERIDIGSFLEVSLDRARRQVQTLNGRIASGENPARERAHIRSEMTPQQLFRDYLENHAKPHKRTWAKDVGMFNHHLRSLADHRISSITKSG